MQFFGVSQTKNMTLEDYLKKSGEKWFLTGKKKYSVQAMMVSKETSFHNELEVTDYTVTDDGVTVILKGTVGEIWTSKLPKVISTYTKPDGSEISEKFLAKWYHCSLSGPTPCPLLNFSIAQCIKNHPEIAMYA